jgi:hypothetical protein
MLPVNLAPLPVPGKLRSRFGARPLTLFTIQTQVAELPSIPEKEIGYSRKPGFTDTRLRPLARRREITAWPLLVFIRVRNPCVFER